MKLSLIVSTYNKPETLELVLESVKLQQIKPLLKPSEIEILIADDGSTNETKELILKKQANFPFKLKHVWHQDTGFRLAAIRNLAVSQSTGEYLIFIDGDCLLPPDYLSNQYKLKQAGFLVAGNRVLISKSYTQEILATKNISLVKSSALKGLYWALTKKTNKFLAPLRFDPNAFWRYRNYDNWKRPKGCNLALFKEDFVLVNGFDEEFSGWGHEDADFLIRLLHLGIKIKDGRFGVPVYHLWHLEHSRAYEAENKKRLQDRLQDLNFILAVKGFKQYA